MTTISSDLTFLTNESGRTLRDRFGTLLRKDGWLSRPLAMRPKEEIEI